MVIPQKLGCLLPGAREAALPAPGPAPTEHPPAPGAPPRSETEPAVKRHTELEIAELLMRNG